MRLSSGGESIPFHPFTGIDLRNDPMYRKKGKVSQTLNLVAHTRGVLSPRNGTIALNAVAWTDVTAVPFGLRFYPTGGTRKKLVYVNKAAGDEIGRVDDTTGAYTALTGLPVLAANKRANAVVFGEVSAAYFANDTNGIIKTTDGIAGAALTGTQIPAACYIAHTPYYDRLIAFHGKRVLYSRTNLDTNWSDPVSGIAQFVWINHPENITAVFTPGPYKSDSGYIGKLYICTPTSTWVQHLDFGSGQLVQIHDTAGVAAPRTLVTTDKGAIGLGTDTVWLFPLDGLPVDIGQDLGTLYPRRADKTKSCAAYHEGFYKLCLYVGSFALNPVHEYWADLRGVLGSGTRYPVQWYGPMIRGYWIYPPTNDLIFSCLFTQPQSPDSGELFACSGINGKFYQETFSATDDGRIFTNDVKCEVTIDKYQHPRFEAFGINGVTVGMEQTVATKEISASFLVDSNRIKFGESRTATRVSSPGSVPEYIKTVIRPTTVRLKGDSTSVTVSFTNTAANSDVYRSLSLLDLSLLIQPFGRIGA